MNAADRDLADGFWLAATLHGGGAATNSPPGSTPAVHDAGVAVAATDACLRAQLEAASPPSERAERLRWVRAIAARVGAEDQPTTPPDLTRASALPAVARALLAGDVPASVGQRFIDQAPPLREGSRDPRLRRLVLAHLKKQGAADASAGPEGPEGPEAP